MGFKLPAIETVRGWIRPLDFKFRFNLMILDLLRNQVLTVDEAEKNCIIIWNKMPLEMPSVILLFKIKYYKFTVLMNNLKAILNIRLRVRIGVCDMSFTNQDLYRKLGISSEKPFSTSLNQKIYFIHDSPHLLKLIRNNLMRKTFFTRQEILIQY
jgi:hypothetical protein